MQEDNKVVVLNDLDMYGRGRNRRAIAYRFNVLGTPRQVEYDDAPGQFFTDRKRLASLTIWADETPDVIVKVVNDWDTSSDDGTGQRDNDNPPSWDLAEFFALLTD
jgi:hypothetical protein